MVATKLAQIRRFPLAEPVVTWSTSYAEGVLRWPTWWFCVAVVGACAGEVTDGTSDGAVVMDGSRAVLDARSGERDAGSDGGATPPDAGGFDAGSPDAGPLDAGPRPDGGPSSLRHTPRPLGTTGAAQGFYEYLPPGYGSGTFPLLVFLHGVGENGDGTTQLDYVLRAGPPRLIDRDAWPDDRPFIVLSPQHSGDGCPSADEVHAFIAFGMSHYDVDTTRVYLTGLSCGAIGSWRYLGRYLDEQIAAAVLIAGDGRSAWSASMCDLGRVAIWSFHGDADSIVAPAGSIEPMTNMIDDCPMPPRREAILTVYPGVGHDSWSRTYDLSAGHDVYTWLLGLAKP